MQCEASLEYTYFTHVNGGRTDLLRIASVACRTSSSRQPALLARATCPCIETQHGTHDLEDSQIVSAKVSKIFSRPNGGRGVNKQESDPV